MTTFEAIYEVIEQHPAELHKPGALSVRPGYEFTNEWITGRPAIVVTVTKKRASTEIPAANLLPDSLDGFPVDVHQATALQESRLTNPKKFLAEAAKLAPEQRPAAPPLECTLAGDLVTTSTLKALPHSAQPHIDYTPAPGVTLQPVTDTFTVLCIASPDQAWPHLKSFLTATKHTLTVGLYDFTSAHILATIDTTMRAKTLNLVLDHPPTNPTADQSDEQTADDLATKMGARLKFAWALDNHNTLSDAWIYPSAYHIKVAVRDHASIWLSSGNWNNSNQPDIDPATKLDDATEARERDRDWHVIIDHPGLAKTFESYLDHGLKIASPHSQPTPEPSKPIGPPKPPRSETAPFARFFTAQSFTSAMTITPLLTPDPGLYVNAVTQLVQSAEHTLYLQYQYVEPNPSAPKPFQDLIAAVVARHAAGVDVKIIASLCPWNPSLLRARHEQCGHSRLIAPTRNALRPGTRSGGPHRWRWVPAENLRAAGSHEHERDSRSCATIVRPSFSSSPTTPSALRRREPARVSVSTGYGSSEI